MNKAPADLLLSKLDQVRPTANGFSARCPAHDDRVSSLSISGGDGKHLLYCHAGCSIEEICAAIGIEQRDLFEDSQPPSRIAATYDYTDEHGNLLFQTVRYEPKDFRQRRPDGRSGWIWKLGDTRRVLYHLPGLLAAPDVVVCEGEKDVETARAWGFVATCNPMGAGKWRDEYSEFLREKRVVIIADADEPGRKHAENVAQSLQGKATSVKVIELPDAKDLHEWASKGGTSDELLKTIHLAPTWGQHKSSTLPWRQAFKSVDQMEQGDVRFLIDQILPEGVTFIGALAGVGKTWFALSIAKALTTGKPFLNNFKVPEPLHVIYLIPEVGERPFRKRLERMRINERFLCRTMKDGVMNLDDPLLLAAVYELRPVVFLDSAIRFNQAENENDASQNAGGLANDIFALIKAGAQGVVGLHHSPKSSVGQEMKLENMLRGTGDMGAMCDTAYGLQCTTSETVELLVKCIKPRDFEPLPPFHIQGRPYIDEIGDFALLREATTPEERAEIEKLDKEIRANPQASYRHLADRTGIALKRIAAVAAKGGWRKIDETWIDTTRQGKFVM